MPNRTCQFENCTSETIIARGLCSKHYQQIAKANRLNEFSKPPRPRLPLSTRFERIGWTVTESGCWEWNGSFNSHGYGQINSGTKTKSGAWKPLIASRVAWELKYGAIPDGLSVCHICDNPKCVNHNHLFLATKNVNNIDMANKKRTRNGERRPQAKLSDLDVEIIRTMYARGNISQRALGEQFGVCASAISLIVNRKRRAHLTYPAIVK